MENSRSRGLCGDRGHWPQHFDEICHLVSKRRKRPLGARDRGGFQELSVSRGAFDMGFVFFGAKGRDSDPIGNHLPPKSDVAKGILTSVRVAKDSQESAIASRAQQVEDVLCQAAWRTVAKARRSSEQYEKIGATRLNYTSGSEGYSLFLANL